MKGNANLSSNKAVYFPPKVEPSFMGAHPPVKTGYGSMINDSNVNYFQSYRNENLAKFQMPPYEWGIMRTPYSPRPDIAALKVGQSNADLEPRKLLISGMDMGRQNRIDDFYRVCQRHRDQYKDHSGRLHPQDYFERSEYANQCPPDLTSTYTKYPTYFVKYKDPLVYPKTLERTTIFPPLPNRSLKDDIQIKDDCITSCSFNIRKKNHIFMCIFVYIFLMYLYIASKIAFGVFFVCVMNILQSCT